MDVRKLAGAALCAMGVAFAANALSQSGAVLVPKTQNNISYVSGGVGKDEQEVADSLRRDGYNVHLVFAEQSGAFMADVRVRLSDSKGNLVLDAMSDGPMFLAKLPPGRYQVVAEARGQTKTATIDATGGAKKVTLHWPSTVDKQGFEIDSTSPATS